MKSPPTTRASARQDLRTPPALFWEIERRYAPGGFNLDAFADDDNHLAPFYFTERRSAFRRPWRINAITRGRVWVQPPFKLSESAVVRAKREVWRGNAEFAVCLLPYRAGTRWVAFAQRYGMVVPFKANERVCFLKPCEVCAGIGLESCCGEEGWVPDPSPFEYSVIVAFQRPINPKEFP